MGELRNFYRCFLDARKHKLLGVKRDPLHLSQQLKAHCVVGANGVGAEASHSSNDKKTRAIAPVDVIVVQQHPAFCGFAAAQTVSLALLCGSESNQFPCKNPLIEKCATIHPRPNERFNDTTEASDRSYLYLGSNVKLIGVNENQIICPVGDEDYFLFDNQKMIPDKRINRIQQHLRPQKYFFSDIERMGYALPSDYFDKFGYSFMNSLSAKFKWQLMNHLMYDGTPLASLQLYFKAVGLDCEYIEGDQLSEEDFRDAVMESMKSSMNDTHKMLIMCSYSRNALGQKFFSGGHVACLGGYDEKEDEILVLEVNSWRYPSVWASCSLLHQGIQTKTSVGTSRGILKVYQR